MPEYVNATGIVFIWAVYQPCNMNTSVIPNKDTAQLVGLASLCFHMRGIHQALQVHLNNLRTVLEWVYNWLRMETTAPLE